MSDSDLYQEAYWRAMDGGAGVQDSVMWQDLAFVVAHTFAQGPNGEDLSPAIRHLDVGAGFGLMVKHMRRRGFESFGVDLSTYAIENADEEVRQYLYPFDMAFVNDTHFGREAFDLITSFETFEHIEAEFSGRALDHVHNLLKPGGVALLNICVEGQPGADRDPTHVNVAPRHWWEARIPRHGFLQDRETEYKLKEFHLFTNYLGTFVLRRPR
jgi:cyclopropane fatty-acyl-phospholipid synthase-like methyltransferase